MVSNLDQISCSYSWPSRPEELVSSRTVPVSRADLGIKKSSRFPVSIRWQPRAFFGVQPNVKK